MMHNVRDKYTLKEYKDWSEDKKSYRFKKKRTLNAYWQGYLKDDDKNFICSYDYGQWNAASFFDNLDFYEDQIVDAIGDHLPAKGLYELLEGLGAVLYDCYADYCERERNTLVISILDDDWDESQEDVNEDEEAPADYKPMENGQEGLEKFAAAAFLSGEYRQLYQPSEEPEPVEDPEEGEDVPEIH